MSGAPGAVRRGPALRSGLLLAVPVGYLLVFFALPIAYMLAASLRTASGTEFIGPEWTLSNYASILSDQYYLAVIGRTLVAGLFVVGLALIIGYAAAYRIAALRPRMQGLLLILLLFPLMVSNVVRAYGWIAILGRRGVLNTTLMGAGLTSRPILLLYSIEGVVLGLMTILLPYMIISIGNALNTIDPRYREAATSLGASPWRTFLHVTLPLSAPGVVTGCLLVFLLTLSAYITISLLGGPRFKLLVSLVFDAVQTFQWAKAGALAFILLALALTFATGLVLLFRPERVRGGAR